MELTINHQLHFFDKEFDSLEQLILQHTKGHLQGIAVAVNQQVISRQQWSSYRLQHQDNILILTATQGG